jgi:hypothetical protein
VKELLEHGQFTTFVEDVLSLGTRTAQNYMKAARWAAKTKDDPLFELVPLGLMYKLGEDDVPSRAEAQIIADLQSGEKITVVMAQERIAQALKEDDEADTLADGFIEDVQSDEFNRHQRQRALLRVLRAVVGDLSVHELQELTAVIEHRDGGIGREAHLQPAA